MYLVGVGNGFDVHKLLRFDQYYFYHACSRKAESYIFLFQQESLLLVIAKSHF